MEEAEETCRTDLKNLLSPYAYNEVDRWPAPTPGHPRVNPGLHYRARIASSCDWGWEYNTGIVRMFPVDGNFDDPLVPNSKVVAGVCTEAFQFHPGMFITCSAELKSGRGLGNVVLGFNVANREGAIVIFDPVRGKPIKWILLPSPVRSVTVISYNDKEGDNRPFFNEAMMAMVGILGVGLEGGDALILDLGLDDPFLSSLRSHRSQQWVSFPNLMAERPHQLQFVSPHESNIATKRHIAVQHKQLITLLISSNRTREMDENTTFYYKSELGETLQTYPQKEVTLCTIDYAPSLGTLIVGFNFGGFQLWRVDNLTLLYANPCLERSLEITAFSVAMPVDDPKNFVYLWVMYGREGMELGSSHVSLYSFGFQSTHTLDNFGLVYDDFDRKCSGNRLTIQLEDVFGDEEEDLDEEDENAKLFVRPLRMWTDPVRRLTFFCWEVNRNGVYYVGIFDMDSWYSNRAVDSIRFHPESSLCPYWVTIPVVHSQLENCIVWDAVVPVKSVEKWEGLYTKHDIHNYPASLSFQGVSLTNHGVITWQHWGVQEKFIRKIDEDGHNLMIEPRSLRNLLQVHGVCPAHPLEFVPPVSPEMQDRFFILTALLDNGRRATITQLARAWFDGSYANVGCSINLLMEWICSLTCCIKTKAKEHWRILLDSRNDVLPRDTKAFLHYSHYAWVNLRFFLATMMRPEQVRQSFSGTYVDDLDYALEKMINYSSALVLLQNANVIPVNDEFDVLNLLTESHKSRRAHVKQALAECDLLEAQHRSIRPMMIDHLLSHLPEDLLRSQWNVEDGQELYPPRSFAYILGMLMWPHEQPVEVYRVVRYFLLDVQDVLTSTGRGLLKMDIHKVAPLSKVDYEDVDILWRFDHGWVKEPLMLLGGRNAGLRENDPLPWIPCTIVSTALGLHSEVKLMLSQTCPPSLAKLYFKLQLLDPKSFPLLCDNVNLKMFGSSDQLLNTFFEVVEECGCLRKFILERFTFSSPWMQHGLINHIQRQPPSFDRDRQLLYIYLMMEDSQKLVEQRESILRLYNLETLDKDQFKEWTRLSEAASMMIAESKIKSPLHSVFNARTPDNKAPQPRKILKIKARKANNASADKVGGLPKLPPQLQRLREQTRQPGPMSPLRKYAARLATFIETPQKRRSSMSKQNSRLRMSLSLSSKNKFVDVEDDADEGNVNDVANQIDETGSLNLLELLEVPLIDHRNPSILSTSVRCSPVEAAETPHSIMRIRGKSPRKHLPVSFVNLTPPKVETIMEESIHLNTSIASAETSLDKSKLHDVMDVNIAPNEPSKPKSAETSLDEPEWNDANSASFEEETKIPDPEPSETLLDETKLHDANITSIEEEAKTPNPEPAETSLDESKLQDVNITPNEEAKTPEPESAETSSITDPETPTRRSTRAISKAKTPDPEPQPVVTDPETPTRRSRRSKSKATTPEPESAQTSLGEPKWNDANITNIEEEPKSPEPESAEISLGEPKWNDASITNIEEQTKIPDPEPSETLLDETKLRDANITSCEEEAKTADPENTETSLNGTKLSDIMEESVIIFGTSLGSAANSFNVTTLHDANVTSNDEEAKTPVPEPQSSIIDPETPTRRFKRSRSIAKTPDPEPQPVATDPETPTRRSTRARSKAKTPDPEHQSSVTDPETPTRRSTRARSKAKTPDPEPQAVVTDPETPTRRSRRSKSKATTPEPESAQTSLGEPKWNETNITNIEEEPTSPDPATVLDKTKLNDITEESVIIFDTSLGSAANSFNVTTLHDANITSNDEEAKTPEPEPQPATTDPETPTRRTRRSKSKAKTPDPEPQPATTDPETPTRRTRRSKSKAKTPEPEPQPAATDPETPTRRSTRARSKPKSPEPEPQQLAAAVRSLRSRKTRVIDFAPELSTVVEDSDRSSMEATLMDTTLTASGSERKQARGRPKKSKTEETNEDDDIDFEIQEKPPKRARRTARSKEPEDSESDTSSVRSTRSSSRRKTPSGSRKRKASS